MPFTGDLKKFLDGASQFLYQSKEDELSLKAKAVYFEKTVIKNFVDKLQSGIDIPNYPQFRDMSKMFFSMIKGIEKIKSGYIENDELSLRNDKADIQEVLAIKRNSKKI